MAKVIKRSNGYEFVGLSTVGMQIVNEFQRQHPSLCEPTSEPDYRFIREGSREESTPASQEDEVLSSSPSTPFNMVRMRVRKPSLETIGG